jgi:hypothetical protein
MRSLLVCVLVLASPMGIVRAAEATELNSQDGSSHEPQPPRRTIGRLAVGVQLGGFYDLGDAAVEVRTWANRFGFSLSLGRRRGGAGNG